MDIPPQDAESSFPPTTTLALFSLLLGIAAVGLSLILFGFVLGVVGIALGMVYLNKKRGPKTMAYWGIGLSLFGVIASIGFGLLYYHYFHLFKSGLQANPGAAPTGALLHPVPLPASSNLLSSNLVWSVKFPGIRAQALCVGDWESDGTVRVLVAAGGKLHVLDLNGSEKSTVTLPPAFAKIECGRNKAGGARLLGYSPFGQQVSVIDHAGKQLWSSSTLIGLDGAHWGDLKGDGNDEMVLGLNGFGGLEALSSDGQKLWSAGLGNVWSQAIIPAASNRPALVLATDASGSVNIYDASGHRKNALRPEGGYYVQMTAGLAESNVVQIVAFSGSAVVAFDQTGKVAWISSSPSANINSGTSAVMADFKGDGTRQWAFLDGAGDLVITTTGGEKIASIPSQNNLQGLAAAARPGQGALLITLLRGAVQAYSFGP